MDEIRSAQGGQSGRAWKLQQRPLQPFRNLNELGVLGAFVVNVVKARGLQLTSALEQLDHLGGDRRSLRAVQRSELVVMGTCLFWEGRSYSGNQE